MKTKFCYMCYKKMIVKDTHKHNKIPIREIVLCDECRAKWMNWKKQRSTTKELI